MTRNLSLVAIVISACFLFSGCAKIPKNAQAVSPFDAEKYMGKWYEIARLDFKFEKDLNNTTAQYTFKEDESIAVLNRGFNVKKNEWQEADGKAKFVGDKNVAELKVTFFGPFYSGYNVIAIDQDYENALVIGESLKYMWILSRNKTISDSIKTDFLNRASDIGYKVEDLVWVEHTE